MNGGIFLTVKDLMILTGSNSYKSAAKSHRAIRNAIADKKRKLTIQEYCRFEQLDFTEILNTIRLKSN